MARYFDFTVLVCSEQHNVKLDIFEVGVHLSVAVHHLELATDFVFHNPIGLDELDCMVVGDAIHDRRGHHELSVHE